VDAGWEGENDNNYNTKNCKVKSNYQGTHCLLWSGGGWVEEAGKQEEKAVSTRSGLGPSVRRHAVTQPPP